MKSILEALDILESQIYAADLRCLLVGVLCIIIFWAIINKSINRNIVWALNSILFIASCLAIWKLTLWRNPTEASLKLIPFQGGRYMGEEYLRTLLMNVILFVPFGMAFPYVQKRKYRTVKTVVTAFALSLGIEIIQYVMALGVAETDDVICNSIGGLLGSLGYGVTNIKTKS